MVAIIGVLQGQAALGAAGDGLGLAALLGAEARIGPGGVDEGQHRQIELLGHVHQPHRLAVALGPGHAEIVLQAGGGVVALLLADDHHRLAAEPAEAADHRLVVGELAVAAQLDELVDQAGQIVDEVRPLGVARHLGLLPRRQPRIGLLAQLAQTRAQGVDLAVERSGPGGIGELRQLLDLAFQFGDRLFELEIVLNHESPDRDRPLRAAETRGWRKAGQGGARGRCVTPPGHAPLAQTTV
jgi:hypothetical protein